MVTSGLRWKLKPIRLVTSRLLVRPFTEEDIIPEYLSWLNDREYMRFSNQRFYDHTRASVKGYLSEFDFVRAAFLALELRDTEELAGTATVFASSEHGTADIGILVGRQFGGQGLAREAVESIAESLFTQGFRKVTIGTSAANSAMLGVISSLGFQPDGVKVKHELIEGSETDVLYFSLFGLPTDS